eukprot:TRINITY_DN5638_c0_g1_i1.p1 TRINITY_DN5638_c0_g1~~TRINITY_DN5638_c0_g1_i1.p1  ORF type:complete len:137 (+),score=64.06 TRINITY_DN5638_c0_g1_i1:65-475(+)
MDQNDPEDEDSMSISTYGKVKRNRQCRIANYRAPYAKPMNFDENEAKEDEEKNYVQQIRRLIQLKEKQRKEEEKKENEEKSEEEEDFEGKPKKKWKYPQWRQGIWPPPTYDEHEPKEIIDIMKNGLKLEKKIDAEE